MTFSSVPDFVAALRASRLLGPDQLDQVHERLGPRHPDARSLARDLLQRGWLTAYQINQLFLGRGTDLVLGDYVVLERLGEGSMGSVFKARHLRSGRVVALKLVRKDRLSNPQALARFQREIRAVSALDHPNIVLALEADEAGDTHFFTMEYVEGTDLSRLVKESGPLPVWVACDYIRQAALGLQHAHENGLVHRDIKPSNLMVTRGGDGAPAGVVKLLDLGLARLDPGFADGDQGPVLTKLQTVLGTPDYISPDQARDARRVDIRGDLYSLGCTLFYLLTGQPPFPGGNAVEKLLRHCSEPPPSVSALRRAALAERRQAGQLTPADEDVPPEVVAVLDRLMAKQPADRYQTPAELAAVLTALLPDQVLTLPPTPPPAERPVIRLDTVETVGPDTPEPFAPVPPPAFDEYRPPRVPPGLWLWLAAVGGGLFLLLALLLMASVGQRTTPPSRHGGLAAPARPVRMTTLPPRSYPRST